MIHSVFWRRVLVLALWSGPLAAAPDPGSVQGSPASTPAFSIPRPTGPYAVGTTTFHVADASRTDSFAGSGEAREIEVIAWYPAVNGASGQPASYFRAGADEGRMFATLMRQPEDAFDYLGAARTWSILDATPRPGDRFPVLLFSHGYAAMAASYTALLEDLASHGYAVLCVVHPFEAVASTRADGRVVSMLDARKRPQRAVRDVLAEWAGEDAAMAAVTGAGSDEERERATREYLGRLPLTTAVVTRWVEDTRLVLDRLPVLPSRTASHLASHADTGRLGAFGHSMGGVTSAQFCVEDRRCRAALNLDGVPQYGPMIDSVMNKPLLMVYSGRQERLGASDIVYSRSARPYVRVDVADTRHLDFTDMVLWGGPLSSRSIFGTREPEAIVTLTRRIVREYFDRELRHRPAPLLDGRESVPGVTVSRPESR